jgi:DNA-binding IclR family transcriptional regulator
MSGVQSIQRAFALLRALAVGQAGITELAERVELPKSTVSRLLSALEAEGAVEQVEIGGDYQLGAGLIDLAGSTTPGRNLIAAARPHLVDLTEALGETSGVAVLEGEEVLYLDHVETDEEVQVRGWTGERAPLHVVPSGFVLMSGQPDADIRRYLANPLEPATTNSLIEPDDIWSRVETVRADGIAWGYGEFDESLNSVAAPVVDATGDIVAAVHVHGPAYRFPGDQADKIETAVREAAERLTAQLA